MAKLVARAVTNIRYWRSILREAERELKGATGRTTLNAAAKKVMRAKTAPKTLKGKSDRSTWRAVPM